MRTKVFFVGMLAAGSLILIPMLGRADIHFFWFTEEGKPRNAMISALQYEFLKLRVSMIMDYPNEYPNLEFGYDESGVEGKVKPRIFEGIKELDTRQDCCRRLGHKRPSFFGQCERRDLGEVQESRGFPHCISFHID